MNQRIPPLLLALLAIFGFSGCSRTELGLWTDNLVKEKEYLGGAMLHVEDVVHSQIAVTGADQFEIYIELVPKPSFRKNITDKYEPAAEIDHPTDPPSWFLPKNPDQYEAYRVGQNQHFVLFDKESKNVFIYNKHP